MYPDHFGGIVPMERRIPAKALARRFKKVLAAAKASYLEMSPTHLQLDMKGKTVVLVFE
jgi:hypothetical protein